MNYDRYALMRELEQDEGRVPYVYKDTEGYDTIGMGFLVDKAKGGRMPDKVIDFWLSLILEDRERELDQTIPWWRGLSDGRQRALMNMAYQLGTSGLLAFRGMLGAMQAGRFEEAADEAMDSRWAKQTPKRAARVSEMIRKG